MSTILSSIFELTISELHSDYFGFGVECNGDTNGWIDVSTSGGAGEITYLWDTGETTQDLENLSAGTYTIIASDENQCAVDIEIVITESEELEKIMKPREKLLLSSNNEKPTVIIFIGVNGSGKTTTIGKLIHKIPLECNILVGACDTFRAAAVEQLKEWSLKQNTDFYQGDIEQDPASLAYTASIKAISGKH